MNTNTELTIDEVLSPPPPKKREFRAGIIQIRTSLLADYGISTKECNIQGELEDKGIFAKVHALLHLPENYTIRLMLLSISNPTKWQICVESPDLPEVDQDVEPKEITPMYVRDSAGIVHLKGIRIEERWLYRYSSAELTPDTL